MTTHYIGKAYRIDFFATLRHTAFASHPGDGHTFAKAVNNDNKANDTNT